MSDLNTAATEEDTVLPDDNPDHGTEVADTADTATVTAGEYTDYTRDLWTALVQTLSNQIRGGASSGFEVSLTTPGQRKPIEPAAAEDDPLDKYGQQGIVRMELPGGTEEILVRAGGTAAPTRQASTSLSWGGYQNGRIPREALAPVRVGNKTHRFEPSAAAAASQMIAAAAADGVQLGLTESYRDYDAQVSVRKRKGHQVATATPGTSVHGYGRAGDWTGVGDTTKQEAYEWLNENGHKYGWVWPTWAQRQGSKAYEPWHREYVGAPAAGDAPAQPAPAASRPTGRNAAGQPPTAPASKQRAPRVGGQGGTGLRGVQ